MHPTSSYCWSRIAGALTVIVLVSACTGNDVSPVSGPSMSPDSLAGRALGSSESAGGLRVFMSYADICVLRTAGVAKCWGRNDEGQLGDGTTTDRTIPTPVGGGLTFSTLALAEHSSCGLTTAGAAYCWGADKERWPWQTDFRLLPRAVAGSDIFTVLTSSDWDGCGITTLGDTKCWRILLRDAYTPQSVPGAPTFVSLTAGALHQCGLTSTGLGYCWGYNVTGQVGNGTSGQQNVPLGPVYGGRRFMWLSAGFAHTCGADLGGTAYCWGNNVLAAVGDGTTTERDIPTRVATTVRFAKVTGGNSHSCGLTSSGVAYCWGNGYEGQLGNGVAGLSLVPVAVQGGLIFRDLVAGGVNTCGVTYSEQIYCWGDNSYGQLLDGTKVTRWTPTLLPL